MRILAELLPGAFLLQPRVHADDRGDFVKLFHPGEFSSLGIHFEPAEDFISTSHRGVLRGMHFQLPPFDHEKLACCLTGVVLDVLLDLRTSSPSYGKAVSAELSEQNRQGIFIPRGVAHGFLSRQDRSLMMYKTSTVHAPTHDGGVRWDSFDFDWPITEAPILSARDSCLPLFASFDSPFK